MLNLAELILSLTPATVWVTFINTDFIASCLARHSGTAARLGPQFRFGSVPSGLRPDETPGGADQVTYVTNFLSAQAQDPGSQLRKLLQYGGLRGELDPRPVTCIIADGWFWFMVDVTKELGVPLVYVETLGRSGLWTLLCS